MSKLKGSDSFKTVIKKHLDEYSETDKLFKSNYNNSNKNFDDCINYILNQVRKSGCVGYEDEEIYSLARHYYDEENIEIGKPVTSGEIIINQQKELTEDDIKAAKEKAIRKIIVEEKDRLRSKPKKVEKTDESKQIDLF
jgi:hypothetical protein